MSTLLLDKNLRGSGNNSEVQTLARARTLTVLGRLDPSRKTAVMQFLVEADLVQRVEGREPIIKLGQPPPPAAYTFAFSTIVPGSGTDLSGAYLLGTDLSGAYLSRADLGEADLSGANLRYAKGTTKKQLEQAKSLEGATMPNGQKHEDWLKSKGSEKDRENSSPS
jgi:hypothetical protein